MAHPRIALVHDDLVQWGGAERVFYKLTRLFPDASIFCAVLDRCNDLISKAFGGREVQTSFMQSVPGWKSMYKVMLPIYPLAFETFDFSGFDLVISHTTRFAKQIVTKSSTTHVCYCHTPPRFLWDFSVIKQTPLYLEPYISYLRWQDSIVSKRVDHWFAGSENARSRIKKVYRADSEVMYPFVEEKFFEKGNEAFNGGYYLVITRLLGYKRVDEVVRAFGGGGRELIVVGSGPEKKYLESVASDKVRFVSDVSDEILLDLIAGCKAVIIAAEEDFGMVSLEAQAMGKPVVAYRSGGSLESVVEGKTGVFFGVQKSEFIIEAMERFEKSRFDRRIIVENARRFDEDHFGSRLFEFIAKLGYSF